MTAYADLDARERAALVTFIGESASSVLAVHALLDSQGRVWTRGDPARPTAVLIESPLVPGEPQGSGDPATILELLDEADG
jgi:hypothetical protein